MIVGRIRGQVQRGPTRRGRHLGSVPRHWLWVLRRIERATTLFLVACRAHRSRPLALRGPARSLGRPRNRDRLGWNRFPPRSSTRPAPSAERSTFASARGRIPRGPLFGPLTASGATSLFLVAHGELVHNPRERASSTTRRCAVGLPGQPETNREAQLRTSLGMKLISRQIGSCERFAAEREARAERQRGTLNRRTTCPRPDRCQPSSGMAFCGQASATHGARRPRPISSTWLGPRWADSRRPSKSRTPPAVPISPRA